MSERHDSRRSRSADEQLAQLFLAFLSERDEKVLEKLIEVATPSVYGVAISITQDASLSEDITQEVFASFYAQFGKIKKPHEIGFWLRRVAFRTAWEWRNASFKALGSVLSPHEMEALWITTRTPLDLAHESEFLATLERCITALPTQQRKCFKLHLEKVPGEAAAASLGISVDTYYSNVSRAIVKLRQELEHFL
jgi:RNA polymerase sigma factor (sigma-70 family)